MDFAKKLLFLCCVLITMLEAMETERNSAISFPKKIERPLLSTPLSKSTTVIQSNFSNPEYQNKIRKELNAFKITTTNDKQWHHINIQFLENLIEDQIKKHLKEHLTTEQENKDLLQKVTALQKPSVATYYPKTTFLLGVLTGNIFAFCAYYAYTNNSLNIFKIHQ